MASYPLAVKTFTTKNAGDTIQPADVNDLQDEVNAIEAGLLNGTARLNSSASTVASLSVIGGSTLATLSVVGNSTVGGNLIVTGAATWVGIQQSNLPPGNTDDLNINTSVAVLIITPGSGPSTLTGISLVGASQGRMLAIYNASANPLVLKNQTGSTTGNQFVTPRLAGSTLGAFCTVDTIYSPFGYWLVKGL